VARTTPIYPLEEVKALAHAGDRVTFSYRADRRSRDLGLSREKALEIIAWLTPDEYDRSLRYSDTGLTWDVYIVPGRLPPSHRKLYIKLRIPSPSVVDQLAVTSFHDEDIDREREDPAFND
jgi:hypothetical protein